MGLRTNKSTNLPTITVFSVVVFPITICMMVCLLFVVSLQCLCLMNIKDAGVDQIKLPNDIMWDI